MNSAISENYLFRFKKYLQDNYQLTEKEWNLVTDHLQCVTVKKNEYFLQKGSVCRMLGFIAEGVMSY